LFFGIFLGIFIGSIYSSQNTIPLILPSGLPNTPFNGLPTTSCPFSLPPFTENSLPIFLVPSPSLVMILTHAGSPTPKRSQVNFPFSSLFPPLFLSYQCPQHTQISVLSLDPLSSPFPHQPNFGRTIIYRKWAVSLGLIFLFSPSLTNRGPFHLLCPRCSCSILDPVLAMFLFGVSPLFLQLLLPPFFLHSHDMTCHENPGTFMDLL